MERQAVTSSNIASVGYDEASLKLHVEFKSGKVYEYEGVDADTYGALVTADSIGSTFARLVRPRFGGRELEACTEWEHCALLEGHEPPCKDIAGEEKPDPCPDHDEVDGPHHSTECCNYAETRDE